LISGNPAERSQQKDFRPYGARSWTRPAGAYAASEPLA